MWQYLQGWKKLDGWKTCQFATSFVYPGVMKQLLILPGVMKQLLILMCKYGILEVVWHLILQLCVFVEWWCFSHTTGNVFFPLSFLQHNVQFKFVDIWSAWQIEKICGTPWASGKHCPTSAYQVSASHTNQGDLFIFILICWSKTHFCKF